MNAAFVRALGTIFHLQCFKCIVSALASNLYHLVNFFQDCGDVVASKFFPVADPDGKQQPLCERDYYRRLHLICANCGLALKGSYITACGTSRALLRLLSIT